MIESKLTKKSRGRPKTAFVSQKPKSKQEGPGRPRKHKEVLSEIQTPIIERPTIIEENKKKDTFILAMFLFSLCVFSISIYFSGKRAESSETAITQQEQTQISEEEILPETNNKEEINTGTINTGNINIGTIATGEIQVLDNEADISPTNTILLSNFYDAFNTNTMKTIYPNIDSRLRNTKLFNVYFSKTRIQRFLRNLSSEKLDITEIESQDNLITYKITYSLLDGKDFEEIREMGIINKDTPQIGKMRCINTGCSTLPFFNPGKYNLK